MGDQSKVIPRRLKGFQDHLAHSMKQRHVIMDAVRAEADLAGFQAIATPALEYSEVLLGVGGETDKQVFRFQDNGDRDVALRFDLTVPFARFVAEHQGKLDFPFKRMQIGDVWRAEKPQKGRFREFCQCDLDIVGVNSQEADTEVLFSFGRILDRIDCGAYTMSVGSRPVLSGMIQKTLGGLSEKDEGDVLIILDKLDKIGAQKVTEQICRNEAIKPNAAKQLVSTLANKTEAGESKTDEIEALFGEDEILQNALRQVQDTVNTLKSLHKDGLGTFVLDLSIARGLGYYTGIVFETQLNDLPEFGSICSGGRYNRLVERYQNRELPGIGGSIGLDRLVAAMEQQDRNTQKDEEQTVFVAIAHPSARAEAFSLVAELRSNGISADIALNSKKIANQFKYADRRGFALVLTIGEDELKQETVAIKDMKTGTELRDFPRHNAIEHLKSRFELT